MCCVIKLAYKRCTGYWTVRMLIKLFSSEMLESKLTQINWNSDKMIFWLLQLLGKALGIPENSVRTYTEAEIRAGYVALF